ncbi:hypothetical protein DFJ73DRAFT_759010 [Zopfochytrium polystomum]|nr:hypothetical protein DFJ73DRAFT_759010 [Zopfochytrium polystomum]
MTGSIDHESAVAPVPILDSLAEEVVSHNKTAAATATATTATAATTAEEAAAPGRVVACAIDSSENAKAAFDWCLANLFATPGSQINDQLVLINCRPFQNNPVDYTISGDYSSSLSMSREWVEALEANARAAAHDLLKAFAAEAMDKANVHRVRAIALRGDPREEITLKVEELRPDLLVVGSRGMGTVKRLFLGSVSDHLMHHVSCPVTVIKMK